MATRARAAKRKRGTVGTLTAVLRRKDWLLAKLFAIAGAVLVAVGVWSVWPYWELSGHFAPLPSEQPSRLYGAPFDLALGEPLEAADLAERLREVEYRPAGGSGLLPGTFRIEKDRVLVARRHFETARGGDGGNLLVVDLRGGRVSRLLEGERSVREAGLDPPLLATFYGPDLLEVRPVPLGEIPTDVVRAILAGEDAGFFEHPGISPSGILRALWTNLRAGGVRQGGSTITQQLAKNLYLTNERRMSRKVREALLAMMLEARYSKRQILEAYLNQIFWGRSGSANLIGIGAAAWAWFGKTPGELDLADGALLAGMIPAPADFDPVRHAEGARDRRDRVLSRMVALDWITKAQAAAAKQEPLPTEEIALSHRIAPYYADAVAGELQRRWGIDKLAGAGLSIFGALDLDDQRAAEQAVAQGVGALAERSSKVRKKSDLFQAALVSVAPASGAVLAYVGGRDYAQSQYDRVSLARRQAGSSFKPIVYAAAFEAGVATPATLLDDEPLQLESGGELWSPRNDDGEYHGWVTARTALEKSYNVPTARLALSTGLERVVATARAFGITTRLRPFPSVALGAFEVTPLELATAYATLADRGVRPPVHLVDAVHDAGGKPLEGKALPAPAVAVSPQTAYLVTALMQGVLDYGTGVRARALGFADPLAGKTGTSNQGRDTWFGGFSPGRATLVWVGFDDNSPTPFEGASAALPIWTTFMLAVRPAGGYDHFTPPPGVRVVLIDPETGELATDRCPEVLAEAFRDDQVPANVCHLHGGWLAQPIDPGIRADRDAKHGGLRGWLHRLFGRDKRDDGERPSPNGPPP